MIVMFRKIALAAVLVTGLMGSAASAHPSHFRPDCGVWWGQDCFGAGDPFGWREEELGFRVSCAQAKNIVRDRGYLKVRVASCGVQVHSFAGLRKGHQYLIKVNGYNGDILSIRQTN
jgi:hypothetical protein